MPSSAGSLFLRWTDSGAQFSECKRYRYRLWREWDASLPMIAFCLLNPSTADDVKNDPTVERCEVRARAMGYGRLEILNAYALRSTFPEVLRDEPDPVGPGNDAAILQVARAADRVVCGWGTWPRKLPGNRDERLLKMLLQAGVEPYCLVQNKDGTPKHPLYVAYDQAPQPMRFGTNRS